MRLDLLASRVQEFRRRFKELTAKELSDRAIVRLCRAAELSYARQTKSLKDKRAFSIVAAQQQYTLADDIIDVETMIYAPGVVHRELRQASDDTVQHMMYMTGIPSIYSINKQTKKVQFYPVPSAAAASTTLNGALTSSATTITVVSTSGFGTQGRVVIDDEVVSYTGISSTTLTGCVRGQDRTVPASHSSGATVNWNDIEMMCVLKPIEMVRIFTTGTCDVIVTSSAVAGTSTAWTTGRNIIAGNWLGIGSYETTPTTASFPQVWYEIESVDSATTLTLVKPYNEATATGNSYFITDKSDFHEEMGETILNGMLAIALEMVSSPRTKDFQTLWGQAVGQDILDELSEDYMPQQRLRGMALYPMGPQVADADYPLMNWSN